uniref:Uncharacterized protein n=1 Tax=Castor canadensis TaxID=51338 RepID=A0A8C0XI95_CASCN
MKGYRDRFSVCFEGFWGTKKRRLVSAPLSSPSESPRPLSSKEGSRALSGLGRDLDYISFFSSCWNSGKSPLDWHLEEGAMGADLSGPDL